MSVGTAGASAQGVPADTAVMSVRELETVTVRAAAPRRMLRTSTDGAIDIQAALLGEQVTLLGSADPLAVVRSLPAVTTAAELQGTLSVRGSSTDDNLFTADGARVVAPLHMLGLFSAFNPAYYRTYTFRAGRVPMTVGPLTAGQFAASGGMAPDTVLNGTAAVGLIESHAAVRVPLARSLSVSAGIRHTYLDALFPRLLTLDDSRLRYGFTDLNAAVTWAVNARDTIRVAYFGNRDRLDIDNDVNGAKDGHLGWRNHAASATWRHDAMETVLSLASFRNTFRLTEGGRLLDLPSGLDEYRAAVTAPAGRLVVVVADITHRRVTGQNGYGRSAAWEYSAAAELRLPLSARLTLAAGLRLAGYHNGAYRLWRPQPRIEVSADLGRGFSVYIGGSRRVRFDRLVEESTAGLPADFWVQADRSVAPSDVYSAEAGVRGALGATGIVAGVELYARRMRHTMEWGGALVDLASPSYDPCADILDGRGYAAGVELSLMRQAGRVRGRISYSYSVSRVRIDRFGDAYVPSSHDRPHDLTVSLAANPWRPLTLSAAYTLASGTPYTRAKYGYMIGENLICEYFPHNSSRLPAYSRLDLAAAYTFRASRRLRHTVTISVYNATASRNVLFRFTSYSAADGIRQRESVMKAVIPSVTYTLEF